MKLLFYFSKGESFNIVIYFIENHASIPHSPMYHRRTQVFSKQLFSATAFLSTCQKSKTKKYISPQQSSSPDVSQTRKCLSRRKQSKKSSPICLKRQQVQTDTY